VVLQDGLELCSDSSVMSRCLLLLGANLVQCGLYDSAHIVFENGREGMGEGEKAWREDQGNCRATLDRLIESVRSFDRGMLHEMVPGQHYPYSFFKMFFRVAYHNIYHAGQIAILKKIIRRIGS